MNTEIIKELHTFFSYLTLTPPDISFELDEEIDIHILSVVPQEKKLFSDSEILEAIISVIKKLLEKKFPDHSLVLDIDGQQVKFINEAKQKAEIAYQRVLEYNKAYEFAYLNAFERMIVHSYLKKKEEVETISSGQGGERRLTVSKRK